MSHYIVTATVRGVRSATFATRVVEAASQLDAEGVAIDQWRAAGVVPVRIVRATEVPAAKGATECVCGAALEAGDDRLCAPCADEVRKQAEWSRDRDRQRNWWWRLPRCAKCRRPTHVGPCAMDAA